MTYPHVTGTVTRLIHVWQITNFTRSLTLTHHKHTHTNTHIQTHTYKHTHTHTPGCAPTGVTALKIKMKSRIGSLHHFPICSATFLFPLPCPSIPPLPENTHKSAPFISDERAGHACCSLSLGVTVCCSVLQCFAMCCSVLQCADQRRVRRTVCDMTHDVSSHAYVRHDSLCTLRMCVKFSACVCG